MEPSICGWTTSCKFLFLFRAGGHCGLRDSPGEAGAAGIFANPGSHYILQLYTVHLAMPHIAGRKGLARFQPSAHRPTFSAQLVGADIAATRKAEFVIRERVLAYHRRAEADPAVSA